MPLYFAYGSNLDRAAMAVRCPRSKVLGIARLMRHRVVILQAGYASVQRDPRAMVEGLLYDLALADVAALDRYEAVAQGLYAKRVQKVIRDGGGTARALIYVGRGAGDGKPLPGYLEGVIAAAREAGLSPGHIGALEGLVASGNGVRSRLPGLKAVHGGVDQPPKTL